jgi:hypothetical protein
VYHTTLKSERTNTVQRQVPDPVFRICIGLMRIWMRIRTQGIDDQKLGKFAAEKKLYFFDEKWQI